MRLLRVLFIIKQKIDKTIKKQCENTLFLRSTKNGHFPIECDETVVSFSRQEKTSIDVHLYVTTKTFVIFSMKVYH